MRGCGGRAGGGCTSRWPALVGPACSGGDDGSSGDTTVVDGTTSAGDTTLATGEDDGTGDVPGSAEELLADLPGIAVDDGGCPVPAESSATGVTIQLNRIFEGGDIASFGVPLPRGVVSDAAQVTVAIGGSAVDASVAPILADYDAEGEPLGVRAVRVQFDAALAPGGCTEVAVSWAGGGTRADPDDQAPFEETSAPSDDVADTVERTIEEVDGEAAIVESDPQAEVVFEARGAIRDGDLPRRLPRVHRALRREFIPASQLGDELAGLGFLPDYALAFGLSTAYDEPYRCQFIVRPDDPDGDGFEGWLYDRCATYLAIHAHTGDTRFAPGGLPVCAFYADRSAQRRGPRHHHDQGGARPQVLEGARTATPTTR